MTQDEQYELLKKELLSKVKSWADIYDYFDTLMARVRTTMHPAYVFDAMFGMYAFLLAMKEMPDEGDIERLADRMVRIMVYESQEKLGAKVTVMDEEEIMAKVAEQAQKVIETIVEVASAEVPVDGKSRILH